MKQKQKSKAKSAAREVTEIILALVIAWLGYQGLALVTGTPLPIVAVVSDSMYHDRAYNEWWTYKSDVYEPLGINQTRFAHMAFPNGLSKGDLIFVVNQKPKVGDVVIYQRGSITIIHRVIQVTDSGYVIRGDNNQNPDEGGSPISASRIRGRALFAMPGLGFPRTIIFEIFKI